MVGDRCTAGNACKQRVISQLRSWHNWPWFIEPTDTLKTKYARWREDSRRWIFWYADVWREKVVDSVYIDFEAYNGSQKYQNPRRARIPTCVMHCVIFQNILKFHVTFVYIFGFISNLMWSRWNLKLFCTIHAFYNIFVKSYDKCSMRGW